MIKFLYPQYLLLCFLLIPSSIFYLARIKNLVKIIRKEEKNYIIKLKLRTFLFSLAWIFLCVALATPVYGTKLVPIQKKGASIIFVMDVSNSMTIKENNISRLSTSKYLADFIIQKYNQYSFALVLAKGEGVLSVPLTFEKTTVLENINALSPLRLTSSGTDLEQGLLKAIASFNNELSNSKIIILFTDGDETKGQLLDVAKIILESEVMLIIVGVGTKEGGDIEVINEEGKKINKHSNLKEDLLIEMAKLSGNGSTYINSNSLYSLFFVLFFFSCNKNEKLIMLEGYISWQQKDWNQAFSHFLNAKEIAENNGNKAEYEMYALSSTCLMQNEDVSAINSLKKIENTRDEKLSSSVFYQLGIIAFKKQEYKLAASYFKKSLEKEPSKIDAKINYELSIKKLDDELLQKAKNAKMSITDDEDAYNAIVDIFKNEEKEECNEEKETGVKKNIYDY